MKSYIGFSLLCALLFICLASCQDDKDERQSFCDIPSCIQDRIDNRSGEFVRIIEFDWHGDLHYLFIMTCCHRIDELYDTDCNYICGPSGAFHGGGDLLCPEFFDEACCHRIIWDN